MNYLAHLYLSGNNSDIILGNFLGDSLKGREYLKYNKTVQKGVFLHRFIDSFTDAHPFIRKGSERLRPGYRKYSGVIVDIFYDHFLAINWEEYHHISLNKFAEKMHKVLSRYYFDMPHKAQQLLPFLIQSKRLVANESFEGIERTLKIMSIHTSLPDKTDFAMEVLYDYYNDFNGEFNDFFKEIIAEIKKDFRIKLPYLPS
ncbi:acyl carrier protein phosphodiesterase [Balneicella halophila]|uniref:Acyl carrier protein phosphodiesterase n=1 Tax=Balneicella halophila TaxID=1537566 RepID=A0A7L4UNG1_BALHA|nr:ACP phosphodiesterase [Balneicella halophila]PVX50710.1 acyl carrier protein phosphodiesterase [Balneicella halophila]